MRRARASAVLLLIGTLARSPCAQTYNPRTIRIESTDATQHVDSSELLRITGLKQGTPLTKADIEQALQKLAGSGDFTNLTYTVDNAALTIRVTPAPALQIFPVRFVNFVWWQQDELLQVLAQRVPLFHGELPLQGNQTGQIEDALVQLLNEKGIPNARITATPSSSNPGEPMNAVALTITSPEILVGQTHFDYGVPALTEKLAAVRQQLAGRNFDLREVNTFLRDNIDEIFQNAGYLDGSCDTPVLITPRKDPAGYVVDVEAKLHPGALYRIGSIVIHPEPPTTEAELLSVLPFKTGDPASASDLRDAVTALARVYGDHAYLRARAEANLTKNLANATVAYVFSFSPGEPFHLASVDTSALPAETRQEFAALWHSEPGALIDKDFQATLRTTLEKLHTHYGVSVAAKSDLAAHTVVFVLQLRGSPGVSPAPSSPSAQVQSASGTDYSTR